MLGTNLITVLWVGAAATVQQGILLPYLSVTAVAGTDATQKLLQFGPQGSCLYTLAVSQVVNNCLDQDLKNLP